MSLKEYKDKRNFRRTPEPTGNGVKRASGHQFVIQKHAARRLHYDFRLEHNGTLKSWAVPKGPSLDPRVKALAVQVEDHPLDYATFEGVIPQGEYGGGTVMVWDYGTWEPEGDVAHGLKEGKLRFRLNGQKLHGQWSLVRMEVKAGEDGKNWLLIKSRDDEAKPAAKSNILEREPRSVVSGREMNEIAADAESKWTSNRSATHTGQQRAQPKITLARKRGRASASRSTINPAELARLTGASRGAPPKNFHPQLATLANRVPEGDNWLHELKFDGYRIIARFEKGKVQLFSRNGNDWTARFRSVVAALEELPIETGILDGELVSLNTHGLSNFQQLQNSIKRGKPESIVYYIFDVPYLHSYDLTQTPLVDRKEFLVRLLHLVNPKNNGAIRYSDHIQGQGNTVLKHACRSGMEGIVCKLADSTYQQSRTKSWLKVKCLKEQEFVIGGYSKPTGSRVGFGALLIGYYENADLIFAGKVGTGFTTDSLRQLTADLKERQIDSPPFTNPPTGFRRRGVSWVRPELVADIVFTEWTTDGRLRHPSFRGLREDKPAEEVVREHVQSTTEVAEESKPRGSSARAPTKGTRRRSPRRKTSSHSRRSGGANADISFAGVRLTNSERVLYPEHEITKRDLAEYYERIADWMLPYVARRPLTIVRCPEGYTGECFYQKHLTGSMPEAVRGVLIEEKRARKEYIMIEDQSGLISLVQMGVLEMHPWPTRADRIERPDYLVFDLDPGEDVEWQAVVQCAKDMRERLEDVGLATFLRTSGGKGLHVVVPIVRRNTWDEIKQFAKSVAEAMTRDAPDRYLATMSKTKRRGKVYIDYLRNQRGATAIACYSTRAREGAPIATPLTWDELTARTRADKYNINNLKKRLDKLESDPWADFFQIRQSLTQKIQTAFLERT